jgi:hypothetical protein
LGMFSLNKLDPVARTGENLHGERETRPCAQMPILGQKFDSLCMKRVPRSQHLKTNLFTCIRPT